MTDLPILDRRKIEAGVLKHVYDVALEKLGRDRAREILAAAVTRSAIEQGRTFADRQETPPDLEDFYAVLPLWTKDGALEIEVLEHAPDVLSFNVTRCRYCESYTEMGLRDVGDILSCSRDADFCIGYNPEIELTRTQTIMSGASHCDFRYRLKGAKR